MPRRRSTRAARRDASDLQDQAGLLQSRLRRAGVAVLCAKVILVPLVFDQAADMAFVVPKALLSHAFAYLLVGIVAALVALFGRAVFVPSWLHVPVLAFLAANVVATLTAADLRLALFGTHERMLGLGTIADLIALYFAVIILVRRRSEAVAVCVSVFAALVVILPYELVQLLGRDPLRWTLDSSSRPFATLGNPTVLSQYLTTLAVGALALGVCSHALDRRIRAGALGLAAVLIVAAAVTGTRSALLGIAAGSFALVVLTWVVDPTKSARVLSIVTAICACLGLAALLTLTPLGSKVATVFETTEEGEDLVSRLEPSTGSRLALYRIGFEMVRERPLLGYGPDNFTVGVAKYRGENEPREIQVSLASSAHSWISYVATGSGLLGLAAFLAIVVVALALLLTRPFSPLAVVGASTAAAFLGGGLTTVNEVDTEWLLWFSLGVVAAGTAQTRIRPEDSGRDVGRGPLRRATSPARAAIAFAVLASAVALTLATVPAFEASRSGRRATSASLAGTPLAIEHALRATQADPGRAEYWHYLGLVYVAAARWREAEAAYGRAVALEPHEVRHLGDLARTKLVLARAGDSGARAAALALAERAVATDRNSPHAQLTRAVVMQVTANLVEANLSVDRAIRLDPQSLNDRLWVTATQIKFDLGHAPEAVTVARRGLVILGRSAGSVELRYELARALVLDNRALEALTELDVLLSIQPYERAERLRDQIRAALGQ